MSPRAYSRAQIALHWLVVAGVAYQVGLHDFMVEAYDAGKTGATVPALTSGMALGHVVVGSLILLAVVARLVLRFTHGVPSHAEGTPPLQARLAEVMHWGLYAALLAMVVTGVITLAGIAPLGEVHFVIDSFMVLMIIAHAAAAIWNQFVRKDGTLARMIPVLGRSH